MFIINIVQLYFIIDEYWCWWWWIWMNMMDDDVESDLRFFKVMRLLQRELRRAEQKRVPELWASRLKLKRADIGRYGHPSPMCLRRFDSKESRGHSLGSFSQRADEPHLVTPTEQMGAAGGTWFLQPLSWLGFFLGGLRFLCVMCIVGVTCWCWNSKRCAFPRVPKSTAPRVTYQSVPRRSLQECHTEGVIQLLSY